MVRQLFVFALVMFAWVFFRAGSIGDAWMIVGRIFTSGFANPHCPLLALGLVGAVWGYQHTFESRLRPVLELRAVRVMLMIALLVYLAFTIRAEGSPFIYMQF